MKLDIYKTDGLTTGEKTALPKKIFDAKPNDHVIYQAIRSYMTNQRQGNSASKNRALVRGGGKKPWRQKGRGVARAGTIRSPLWVGGGRIFGPIPHDYHFKIPKKMNRLARISALSYKAQQNEIMIIEDFVLEHPKTREIHKILKSIKLESTKVLLVTAQYDGVLLQAGRNIPNLNVRMAETLCTYDILDCKILLIQKSALDIMKEVLKV